MIKKLSLVLVVILLVSCFSGCESSEQANASNRIDLFSYNMDRFDGATKDSVWLEMEKITGTTINLSGVSLTSYTQKINMMVNTNEAPDIFFYLPDDSEAYAKWVKQGMLLDIGSYVKDDSTYPNLYRILNSYEYKDLKYYGKQTIIPFIAVQNNWAIYIRQDWLDNLGLKQPKTLEEFEAVMHAFTYQDPDRNGKHDTYGLCGSKDAFWFMPFYAAFVPKDSWAYTEDGTAMEFQYCTDEYKDYLRYMSSLYEKGYIVKDYYTKPDDMKIENFASGKAGILIHNAGDHIENIMSKVNQASPTAIIDVIAPPEGPAGANLVGWGGWWGGYSISAGCKNPEAALRLLDFLISPEGQKMRFYGIKDVHYTEKADGTIEITEENLKNRLAEPTNSFLNIRLNESTDTLPYGAYAWGTLIGSQYDVIDGKIVAKTDYTYFKYKDLANKAQAICEQYATIPDFYNIGVSDTSYIKSISKINDYANIYTTNIIIGEKSVDEGWAEYMKEVEKAGYADAAIIAYNAVKEAGK